MAIIDRKLQFSDAQVIANGSGSAAVAGTDVISFASVKDAWGTSITNDFGEGNNGLVINWQVAVAITASVTFECRVYTHTTSAVTSGTELGSVTFAAAAGAGTRKQFRLPAGTMQKWIGVTYSNAVDDSVSSAFDCWLGLDSETPSTYTTGEG